MDDILSTGEYTRDGQDNPGLIAPPPLIYAGALLTGLILNWVFPIRLLSKRTQGTRLTIGVICVGLAFTVVRGAFQQMRTAKTNVNPTLPTLAIVTGGPYQVTRNPIYLSLTLLYAGLSLLLNTFWTMLLLPFVLFVMNRGVIDREEQYLERKFGEQYLRYKRSVGRWF